MLKPRPQGSLTFKSRSLGYPELALLLRSNENIIGSGGSIVSALGT
jgi:hypothetical protein